MARSRKPPPCDSSSESEAETYLPGRRELLYSAPPAKTDEKKKKKKKLEPQQAVDRIWTRFSQKRFSKALAVLPFAPVPLPAAPERGNELLSAGYERAADECRRKVRKIIEECKRVNMRYRDAGWDLVRSYIHTTPNSRGRSRNPAGPLQAANAVDRFAASRGVVSSGRH